MQFTQNVAVVLICPTVAHRDDGAVPEHKGRNVHGTASGVFRQARAGPVVLRPTGVVARKPHSFQATALIREGRFGRVFNPGLQRDCGFAIHQRQLTERNIRDLSDTNRVRDPAPPVWPRYLLERFAQDGPVFAHRTPIAHAFASQGNVAELAGP